MTATGRINKKLMTRLIVIIAAVLVIAVVAAVSAYLFLRSNKLDTTFRDPSMTFRDPDYETDILADEYYLRQNRDIMFTENGDGELITEQNHSMNGGYAAFFYDYFQTVIHGDYESYPSYFTQNFFKSNTIPERFTMQRLYDIEVELYSRTMVDFNGSEAVCSRYLVSYCIQYNNGTFRGDFNGYDRRPILFTLIEQNGEILINSITQIQHSGA